MNGFSLFTLTLLLTSLAHGRPLTPLVSYHEINKVRDVTNPEHTPQPSAWTQESRVGDTLFIDGEIQDIQWSFLKFGEYKGVKRIVLNSYGGLVAGALDFAEVIREQGLTTVIPAGGVCMSACTLIFQAGAQRQSHTSAIFMYHAPRSGHIGMANLETACKQNGPDYCEKRKAELIERAPQSTHEFFQSYQNYGLNAELEKIIFSLPEEEEQVWSEDGNWFKKVDLVFAQDPHDPRILEKLHSPEIRNLEELEDLNVVTSWFTDDPGWRIDPDAGQDEEISPLPYILIQRGE